MKKKSKVKVERKKVIKIVKETKDIQKAKHEKALVEYNKDILDTAKLILNKVSNRTKEDFNDLLSLLKQGYRMYTKRDIDKNEIINKWTKLRDALLAEYKVCNGIMEYNVMAQKSKKVFQEVTTFRPADETMMKETMGDEVYEEYLKKKELLKVASPKIAIKIATVEREIPIKIWMDYDTGLFVGEMEIYKDFLFSNERMYSFGEIAKFLGFEINTIDRGTANNKDIYLMFRKVYSEMEYYTINDIFAELNTDVEKEMWMSKKILTLDQVKHDIESGVNKIIEFSNIIDNTVKKLTGPEI